MERLELEGGDNIVYFRPSVDFSCLEPTLRWVNRCDYGAHCIYSGISRNVLVSHAMRLFNWAASRRQRATVAD